MSSIHPRNLTLTIGGRNHVVAIVPGEEDHLTALAAMIDERIRTLGLAQGQTEARMLLYAALTLADELHALHNQPAASPPLAPPPAPPLPPPETAPSAPEPIAPEIVALVAQLADRVETLAARLEQSDLEN